MTRSRAAAFWIIGIGILHCGLFLWLGRGALRSVVEEGVWNTIDPVRERQVLFWALLTGIFGLLLGQLALWVARRGDVLPTMLGWQILAITLVCGILMPVSGAWLCAVPGALIVWGSGPERKTKAS